jgi:hypothetical protein
MNIIKKINYLTNNYKIAHLCKLTFIAAKHTVTPVSKIKEHSWQQHAITLGSPALLL